MKISFIVLLLCFPGVICKQGRKLKKDHEKLLELIGSDNLRNQIKRYLNLFGTDYEIGQRVRDVLNKYSKHPVKLVLASRLYLAKQFPLLPGYVAIVKKYLNMEARNIAFDNPSEVETTLNTWIKGLTHNNIKILIESLSDVTAFIMPNVVLMEAAFRFPFDKSLTKLRAFENWSTGKKNVHMMRHQSLRVKYNKFANLDAQVIELPTFESSVSIFIILPNKLRGLNQLKEKLNKYDTLKLSKNLKERFVDISLPRFNVIRTTYLREYLENNGLNELFGIGSFPKFTNTTSRIHMHNFKQTVAVKIDENGLFSPAATFRSLNPRGAPADLVFLVNRPFAFYIQDDNNVFFKGFIYSLK